MRWTVLQRFLRNSPFKPFKIVLTDGSEYEIRHPDQASANLNDLEVLLQNADTKKLDGEFVVCVSYLHIIRIEPILPQAAGNLNGSH